MAGNLIKYADRPNSNVAEYCVDTIDELALLPTTTTKARGKFANDVNFKAKPAIGSTCIVGNSEGDILYYILFSDGWKQM